MTKRPRKMCLVLISKAWVAWAVVSVCSTALMLAGHLSPQWLLGFPVVVQYVSPPPEPMPIPRPVTIFTQTRDWSIDVPGPSPPPAVSLTQDIFGLQTHERSGSASEHLTVTRRLRSTQDLFSRSKVNNESTNLLVSSNLSPQRGKNRNHSDYNYGYEYEYDEYNSDTGAFEDVKDGPVDEGSLEDEMDHTVWPGEVMVRPSLGLWLRCSILAARKGRAPQRHCGVYATTGADLPAAQVVSMCALVTGTGLSVLASLSILLSACVRSFCGKSIFNLIGSMQALAGLFCIAGLFVYPLSWTSVRTMLLCGPSAGLFNSGDCSLGWAILATIAGTVTQMLCALAAIRVDGTISSNLAEEQIRRGNRFVFA